MAQKTIKGSEKLAKQIRVRRNELNLTIEEAASRAGVGTKTWSRYEAGESIRVDKCKGICKALNWRTFPMDENEADERPLVEEYRDHEAWSQFLAENFGTGAAMSFAAGSDILLDFIQQDMTDLASMPVGSHIGQLGTSMIDGSLPPQFLMQYDYDFLYQMKCTLLGLRWIAGNGLPVIAHSVMEELLIYLCNEEAQAMLELSEGMEDAGESGDAYLGDWVFDLFDDEDIITFLYSDQYLTEEHPFHFSHWNDQQFYMDSGE